jgi:hypothetical protein
MLRSFFSFFLKKSKVQRNTKDIVQPIILPVNKKTKLIMVQRVVSKEAYEQSIEPHPNLHTHTPS